MKAVQGSRMPEITLSLPAALGLLALFVAIGALLVYFFLQGNQPKVALKPGQTVVIPTASGTTTITPTITVTPTITPTETPIPTFTPLPPVEYTVVSGDNCSIIAATFKVSINSIILANNLAVSCPLYVGLKLKIPQPTPTASPMPTSTLNSAQATDAACQKVSYTVVANDTISAIAATYGVTIASIRNYNGLPNDAVLEGQTLIIPLCERAATAGPSPTPTPPAPYPATNLLLPADGAAFTLTNDTISLQWASVGTLRSNEKYSVTFEDVTAGEGNKHVDYVPDTKYIIPASMQPTDNSPHIWRWWIMVVRQVGTDAAGNPIWESAGEASVQRVFSWTGIAAAPNP
jgi:LysM repeat protein